MDKIFISMMPCGNFPNSPIFLPKYLFNVRRGKSQCYQPEDATLNDRNVRFVPGLGETRVINLLPSPVGFSGFTRVFLGFVGNTGSYDNALHQVQVK